MSSFPRYRRPKKQKREVSPEEYMQNRPCMELVFPDWLQKWPQHVDVNCLWCCHPFDTVPIPLPMERNAFRCVYYRCRGLFCSFNCAKAYAFNLRDSKVGTRCTYLFELLYHMCYYGIVEPAEMQRRTVESSQLLWGGCSVGITAAPDRTVLKAFGGSISIEQYRARFVTVRTAHPLHTTIMKGVASHVIPTARWFVIYPLEQDTPSYNEIKCRKREEFERDNPAAAGEVPIETGAAAAEDGDDDDEKPSYIIPNANRVNAKRNKKPRVMQHRHRKRTMDIGKLSETVKKQRLVEHEQHLHTQSSLVNDFGIEYEL